MTRQNVVQGKLVNGSIGRVIGFSTPREAREREVDVAKTEEEQAQSQDPSQEFRYRVLAEDAERNSWPEVKFQNGLVLLCIPTMFDAVNAEARIEATRKQVCVMLGSRSARNHVSVIADPSHTGVGLEYTQVARTNLGTRASQSGECFRGWSRSGLRNRIAGSDKTKLTYRSVRSPIACPTTGNARGEGIRAEQVRAVLHMSF